jgi:hypothetical protein
MVLAEIVRTCSNPDVADAALASIGGRFAESFVAEASRRNLTPGVLTALIVKDFQANATFEQMEEVVAAASSADQPVLAGLRYILIQSGMSKLTPMEEPPKSGASIRADAPAEKGVEKF